MVFNDLVIMPEDTYDRYQGEKEIYHWLEQECNLPVFKYNYFQLDNWHEVFIQAILPSFSNDYANKCYLDAIAHKLSENEKVLFVNTEPMGKHIVDPKNQKEIHRMVSYQYSLALSQADLNYLELLPFEEEYITVSKTELHPSVKTHQLYAERIYEEIISNDTFGFSD